MTNQELVRYEATLTSDSFVALINGTLLALSVSGFFDVTDAAAIRRANERFEAMEGYDHQPVSLGAVLTELLNGSSEEYFQTAAKQPELLREVFPTSRSPIEKLHNGLSCLWSAGVRVAELDGGRMSSGTVRYYRVGDLMNPHVDRKQDLVERLCERCRLAANVYLDVPAEGDGGELELWSLAPDEQQAESWLLADYSLDREKIGPPDVVLHPKPGDLILFDSERVHAVTQVRSGSRLTASCFIGVRAFDQPLNIFA